MIPISELKIRGLYKVDGRNFSLAVWDGACFIGRRHKFCWRLSGELHHDADPNFGTVRPVQYLCQVPEHLDLRTDVPCSSSPQASEMNYALFGYLTAAGDEVEQ